MPWVVPLVVAAYGAYASNKARQRAGDEAKKAQSRQDEMMNQFLPYGKDMLGTGKENMGLVQAYLRNQLSGDRGLTMQTVAPEINAMSDQARGSVAAQRSAMPRGGMGAAAGADTNRQLQSGINNLLFSVRPRAAEQLAQLGGNQSSLGLGAMGQGVGLTNSMLQYGLDARNQQMMQGQSAGQGMGGLMQLAMMYMNNRPNNQTATSPYGPQSPNWTSPNNAAKGNNLMGSSPYANYGIYSMPGRST